MKRELRFTYATSGDAVRYVVEWLEAPAYIRGYCVETAATRTFRKDRITSWLDGTDGELRSSLPPRPRRREKRSPTREILFTGLAAAERAALEAAAERCGWTVRKTVSQTLTCLVCGPNAGPSKIERAMRQGSLVVDVDEVTEAFLRHGEVV